MGEETTSIEELQKAEKELIEAIQKAQINLAYIQGALRQAKGEKVINPAPAEMVK